MRPLQFQTSVILPAPPAAAFAFHLDPANLVRISPPWIRVTRTILPPELGVGSRLQLEVRAFGLLPQRWEVEIAELVAPQKMVDVALRSPYALWRHTHSFRAVPGGTEMTDRVEYELPFGTAGRLLDPWMHRPFLAALFRFRHRRTRELLSHGTPVLP